MQIKLSDGRIEEATFKAVIERSGNSYAGWSMNWEDNVARDDKTHRSAKKNVAGKMITGGDTGEADGASQARRGREPSDAGDTCGQGRRLRRLPPWHGPKRIRPNGKDCGSH